MLERLKRVESAIDHKFIYYLFPAIRSFTQSGLITSYLNVAAKSQYCPSEERRSIPVDTELA